LVCRKIASHQKYISKAGTIQVHERTAQQELIAEPQTTGLETRGRRQEAQSGSERINEGQGGQNETSHIFSSPLCVLHAIAHLILFYPTSGNQRQIFWEKRISPEK
jgi:hypothetical protein